MTNDANRMNNDKTTSTQSDLSDLKGLDAFLSGFQFVESDGAPYIALDNQRRFYINATTRKLLGVKPYDRVAIAYSPDEQALAIVKMNAAPSGGLLATSQYVVDKRYYMSARHFSRVNALSSEGAPYYFDYVRGKDDGTAFVFRLRRAAED